MRKEFPVTPALDKEGFDGILRSDTRLWKSRLRQQIRKCRKMYAVIVAACIVAAFYFIRQSHAGRMEVSNAAATSVESNARSGPSESHADVVDGHESLDIGRPVEASASVTVPEPSVRSPEVLLARSPEPSPAGVPDGWSVETESSSSTGADEIVTASGTGADEIATAPNRTRAGTDRERESAQERDVLVTLYFQTNGWRLSGSDLRRLRTELPELRRCINEGSMIVVTGHTDDSGFQGWNDRLGLIRANSVLRAMSALHLDQNIVARSQGQRKPSLANASHDDRRLNRRAVLACHPI